MFPLLPSRSRAAVARRSRDVRFERPCLALAPRLDDARVPPGASAPFGRILLVALGDLTDLVFTSALAPLLRERHPTAEITLWCTSQASAIGAMVPGIDRVESVDPCREHDSHTSSGNIFSFAASVRRLRQHEFDVAVLTEAPWRAALAVAATGASRRIGLASKWNSRCLTDVLSVDTPRKSSLYEMARLLEPLGIRHSPNLRYQLDAEPLAARRERFRALLGPRPAALHPFGSTGVPRVPLKQWIRLAVELSRRGYDPLWIGRSSELKEVHRAVGSVAWKYVDRFGDGSIADAAAAISLATILVGHNSSRLHVASALGVPTVGILTPEEATRRAPRGMGESRLLITPIFDGVTSADILEVIDELPHGTTLKLLR